MSSNPLEDIWIDHVQSFIKNGEEDGMDGRSVSIFGVPKTLKTTKREAYKPQLLAIGPYHHWQDATYAMEQHKVVAARKAHSHFKSPVTFLELVEELGKVEYKIRARYHKYLAMKPETLAWIMAIDGLFLLQFIYIFVNRNESVLATSARMSFLVGSDGRKLGYDSILKDIMMLENQIPLYTMKKVLKILSSKKEVVDNKLPQMLLGVCSAIAPLKLKQEEDSGKILKSAHLLDILYHLMVPMCKKSHCENSTYDCEVLYGKEDPNKHQLGCFSGEDDTGNSSSVFKDLFQKVSAFGPLKKVSVLGPMISEISSHITGLSQNGSSKGEIDIEKPPQVEEIMIPTVTNLINFGVKFRPTSGDISTVKFDTRTKTFHLPVVKLDVNSEVILRNLVVYEACAISGPLVLARYTELMNGIIDTAEDAKILSDKGIIESELSYQDMADLWNGMHNSIRLTHVYFIDKAITDVNKCFFSTRRVRLSRAIKAYVYGSWRILVILPSLLVIALMCVQSFCTVYNCPRQFHLETER